MSRYIYVLLLALGLLAACTKDQAFPPAQEVTYDVDGYLLDSATQSPLNNMLVRLVGEYWDGMNFHSIPMGVEVRTDSSGFFSIHYTGNTEDYYGLWLEAGPGVHALAKIAELHPGLTHLGNVYYP
ncbi:MAG: hypothetical protein AB1458_04915 [Bacteroidota bacterium]